ncbi:MAG: thermonuclease family protein, partial [Candidatus Aminicenantes bacterium]|nr:thermonuclease family protein [Candidatus Aminicenantes bacterium]
KKVQVEIESYAEDGVVIGRVIINNQDLSMTLVEAGLAWYYKDHGTERYLAKAQRKAKRNKIGLWVQKKPVAPWSHREQKQKQ